MNEEKIPEDKKVLEDKFKKFFKDPKDLTVFKCLSKKEQNELLNLLKEYEEKYPDISVKTLIMGRVEDGLIEPKFERISELSEKASDLYVKTDEYKKDRE